MIPCFFRYQNIDIEVSYKRLTCVIGAQQKRHIHAMPLRGDRRGRLHLTCPFSYLYLKRKQSCRVISTRTVLNWSRCRRILRPRSRTHIYINNLFGSHSLSIQLGYCY